jgi:hypothetical protein
MLYYLRQNPLSRVSIGKGSRLDTQPDAQAIKPGVHIHD